jgi:hypothetical protein
VHVLRAFPLIRIESVVGRRSLVVGQTHAAFTTGFANEVRYDG